MINFKPKSLDENLLYKKAESYFFKCAEHIFDEDQTDYNNTFNGYALSELKTELFKVQYTKYIESTFLSFDGSTELHCEIHIHIYAFDKDKDHEQLANYRLILNDNLEVVDDFLS